MRTPNGSPSNAAFENRYASQLCTIIDDVHHRILDPLQIDVVLSDPELCSLASPSAAAVVIQYAFETYTTDGSLRRIASTLDNHSLDLLHYEKGSTALTYLSWTKAVWHSQSRANPEQFEFDLAHALLT